MGSGEELDAQLQARGLHRVWAAAEASGEDAVARLRRDLESIDWDVYDRQRALLRGTPEPELEGVSAPPLQRPSAEDAPEHREARERGWEALQAGEVAVVTVAGGQASRLGFEGPKGAFPIGPVTGASLFQGLAGQLHRLRERAGAAVPWVVQTGPANHADTRRFLAKRSWFGLGSRTVELACQGTLPALASDGSLLLAAPDRLFRNPDGHGGVFRALKGTGTLQRLRQAGVRTVFYCQVDNPLVWLGDPVFLGHHLLGEAQMSVKVVEKTDPEEKVGLVVEREGRLQCLEYSDLSPAMQADRAADGGLRFRAGNIAIHAFDLDFLEAMAEAQLPLHAARKKIRALGPDRLPDEVEGVKFEGFVFDALPLAERAVAQLADREQEFAPVKNRAGKDSIATARAAIDRRTRRWVAAGLPDATLDARGLAELAPGVCLDADDLAQRAGAVETWCGRLVRAR